MKAIGGLSILLLAGILLGGCSETEELYPFYEWDTDSDTDSDTGEDDDTDTGSGGGDTDTGPDTDSDTNACDDDYTDDEGRCIRYVDWNSNGGVCGQSWEDAFTRIQDGIASAYQAGQHLGYCEVWVADGTYRSCEGVSTDTIRLRDNVHVFGGFTGDETIFENRDVAANETIIDGRSTDGAVASYHVVTGTGTSTLDGFTITGGQANGDPPHHRGGGIYINTVDVTVRNCAVVGNTGILGGGVFAWDASPSILSSVVRENAATSGGGIYILNGTATVEDTVVSDNEAAEDGGGVYLEESLGTCAPTLRGVTVSANAAGGDGGGIYNRRCGPSIDESVVADNLAALNGGGLAGFRGDTDAARTAFARNTAGGDGGGVWAYDDQVSFDEVQILWNDAEGDGGGLDLTWADGSLSGCRVAGNDAAGDGGGVYLEMDFTRVEESLVTGNRAYRGGGMYNGMRGDPALVNAVISGNGAQDAGGALYNADHSAVSLINSVIWDNGPDPVVDEPGSGTEISYSDVEGSYPGTGNVNADPLFVDPGYFDDMGTTFDTSDDTWVAGDYHLTDGSPCVDTADDLSTPPTDMDGQPWEDLTDAGLPGVLGDMGAYDLKP